MTTLEFHRLAAIFPLVEGAEFDEQVGAETALDEGIPNFLRRDVLKVTAV
jgi:hypothetical protein